MGKNDEMTADLKDATDSENEAMASFDELVAAKAKEIDALIASIESKTTRSRRRSCIHRMIKLGLSIDDDDEGLGDDHDVPPLEEVEAAGSLGRHVLRPWFKLTLDDNQQVCMSGTPPSALTVRLAPRTAQWVQCQRPTGRAPTVLHRRATV